MKKYFVWIETTRGPAAQIWYDEQYTGAGQQRQIGVIGKPIEIPYHKRNCTLDELIEEYQSYATQA